MSDRDRPQGFLDNWRRDGRGAWLKPSPEAQRERAQAWLPCATN